MKKYSLPPGYNFLHSLYRSYKQIKSPVGSMEESMARFNGTYSVRLGMQKFIATQDPVLIDHVLRSNQRNYNKSAIQTERLGKFLGNGLLTSSGDYWLRQRRLIQPGFHVERIHALYAIMQNTVRASLHQFPVQAEVDMYPLVNRLSFNIVINTLFNVEVPEKIQNELSQLIFAIQDYIIRDLRRFYKRWWHRLSGEESENYERSRRVRQIIRDMIRQRQNDKAKYNDLLDMLLDARYEDNGEPMTEEQLIDEITILIIAGHETTANALAWTLYLLSIHPEMQNALFEEATAKDLSGAINSELINGIIKESMRLYPPAWISDRVCVQDDKYKDIDIPAGTIVVIFYYGMHRDPKHWTDPDSFNPQRFFKQNFDKEKSKTYYPFGAGPRLCIGNNFAMAEMAIFLYDFIRVYKVKPGGTPPKLKPLVTLKPDKMLLILERR